MTLAAIAHGCHPNTQDNSFLKYVTELGYKNIPEMVKDPEQRGLFIGKLMKHYDAQRKEQIFKNINPSREDPQMSDSDVSTHQGREVKTS